MIGYPKKNKESYPRSAFDKQKKKRGLKFNPGLALTGVRTTEASENIRFSSLLAAGDVSRGGTSAT